MSRLLFFRRQLFRKILLLLVFLVIAHIAYRAIPWYLEAPRSPARDNFELRLPEGKDPLRFIAVGDTGTGDANQRKVAGWMEKICLQEGLDGILNQNIENNYFLNNYLIPREIFLM